MFKIQNSTLFLIFLLQFSFLVQSKNKTNEIKSNVIVGANQISEYENLLKDPLTVITQDAYGFAIGRLIDDEAELLMIAIVQERQGLGNGKQHLQLFEAIVTRKGAKFCFLEVSESNINARALYQAQNFKEIGRLKAYYQIHENHRMDAIIMRKSF